MGDFRLQDFRGKWHTLSDFDDRELLVVAVLGTECPLAKLYGPRLQRLGEEFSSRGVGFVAINANRQDSVTEMAAYARVHDVRFPMLKDPKNEVVDRLGAERTPEVFLLDAQRNVRYRGRVDDQYGVGYVRSEPKRHDLRVAIEELLAGKEVSVSATEPVGCHIGRIKQAKADAEVTYSSQIARILQSHCVECHRAGDIAPFALTEYDEVVGWAEMIREVVQQQRMPPWHADSRYGQFRNDRSLSESDRELIYQWVADGAPDGDASQLPAPPTFPSGWCLPDEPDLVVSITEEPFAVQAEGAVEYQWFTVDPELSEDKWLQAAEILPGNRAVVHHILAFVREPGETRKFTEGEGFLVGYVPGLRARPFPQGMAKLIPAGSELVFQVHYTPIGSVQYDQSQIGLVFADPKSITHRVQTSQAINFAFEIPPHDVTHQVVATSPRAPREVLLLSMMPHMHLRGKSIRYEAQYADGTTEILLDVPRYDFNWQTSYRLAEPQNLPVGTRIRCVAHYDNSDQNLNNPDPEATVRWGDQTWEEMMIGYFDIAWRVEPSISESGALPANAHDPEVAAELLIGSMDDDADGQLARKECPPKWLVLFFIIDGDHDGTITLPEMTKAIEVHQQREANRAARQKRLSDEDQG